MTECYLKDVKCLIAGEIDCKDEDEYVEMKTANEYKLSEKMQLVWLQGYLIGNHKLVYGLRDNNFSLVKVIEEPIESVRRKYEQKGKWDGDKSWVLSTQFRKKLKTKFPTVGPLN